MSEKTTINAPMPGIFYRKSDPDQPPFAEPGDRIEAGDTIGLVEVMKNFNEIKASEAGTISKFLVENEGEIEADQPLVELK